MYFQMGHRIAVGCAVLYKLGIPAADIFTGCCPHYYFQWDMLLNDGILRSLYPQWIWGIMGSILVV